MSIQSQGSTANCGQVSSTLLTIALILAVALFCYFQVEQIRRNIEAAKSSGINFVVLPFHIFSTPWAIIQAVFLPLIVRLPESWTESWLPMLAFSRGWHYGYEPFRKMGTDTFMVVSPTGNVLHTCDPNVITQLFRGNKFGKPTELLKMLNIFGPTLTGTDGDEARQYRKITAPFFNEETLHQVWINSVSNIETTITLFGKSKIVNHFRGLRPLLAWMALRILNTVCFEGKRELLAKSVFSDEVLPGHALSYSEAMHSVLDHFGTISYTPFFVLNHSPLQVHKRARQAYSELNIYLEELRDHQKSVIKAGDPGKNSSLLGQSPNWKDLIVRAGEIPDTQTGAFLSKSQVLGNMFIFMFAGHEANANTLVFLILLLACRPRVQKSLQQDISNILGGKAASHCSLETDYPLLMGSHVGAVIYETLRLFTVLPFIPKVVGKLPQPIAIGDRTCQLPAKTLVLINTSATHRNPKYWVESQGESRNYGRTTIADFNPAQWVGQVETKRESFLRPKPGSFIAFSEGDRGCLGRRFALVELCATVTMIFSEYSVELAVEALPSNASVEEKINGWRNARTRAEHALSSDVEFHMALRMMGNIPIDFVRIGNETFAPLQGIP